ncbi:MAG: hypothetical protein WD449_00505 [Candidatus Babeliales bacterium]
MSAPIHNLRNLTKPSGTFLLDTNVLLWYTYEGGIYPAGKSPQGYQSYYYPEFVKLLLTEKAKIYYSIFSLAELYHTVEKIYVGLINDRVNDENSSNYIKYPKQLRTNHPIEKQRMDRTFEGMCTDIEAIGSPIPTPDPFNKERLMSYIQDYKLDAFDAMIYYSMNNCGLENIVTDDGDFKNVNGLHLYTANNTVLKNR